MHLFVAFLRRADGHIAACQQCHVAAACDAAAAQGQVAPGSDVNGIAAQLAALRSLA